MRDSTIQPNPGIGEGLRGAAIFRRFSRATDEDSEASTLT